MRDARPAGTAELSHVTRLMPIATQFVEAMDDDLNTPRAIAALFDLNRQVNELLNSGKTLSQGTLAAIDGLYRDLGGQVLGIISDDVTPDVGGDLVEGLMDIILAFRRRYRENKDWEQADALRERLNELGIVVEDRPEGPTWWVEPAGRVGRDEE
jgi:cysteinyl-tRNA synthetase